MPWNGEPGGGFTTVGVRPWLPMADPAACNVADQEGRADSVLELCRRAIAARRASEDLAVGSYRSLPSPEGTWVFARGARTTVALNMSEAPQTFSALTGTVRLSTLRPQEGEVVEGSLTLTPWSGAVIER